MRYLKQWYLKPIATIISIHFSVEKDTCFSETLDVVVVVFLDLPFSPDRSYNFSCFSSFFRPFFRSFVRPSICLFVRLSVRPSVRSFVRPSVSFSQNWIISSDFLHEVKGLLEAKKWRSPIFVENSFLPKFQHIGYFGFFWKCCRLCFLKTMQNENYFNSWLSLANLMSAKFMFWSYQPKCSWPIRL